MLVLSRKLNESIVIGNVTVTVVHLDRQRCRLGITAPAGTSIRRTEIPEPMEDTDGMRLLLETEVGREARRNATQASDDTGQEDD